MSETDQLTLQFDLRQALSGEDFLVSECNQAAVGWIDAWPDWPAPALVIVGPSGSGKSHLAAVFAARSGAREVTSDEFGDVAPKIDSDIIVENVDADWNSQTEEALLHLYNAANENGNRILFTAQQAPVRWNIQLPDLRSRLNAAPVVEIGPPEDTLIAAILVKMFADRQVKVSHEVIAYTISRMERSFQAARKIVQLSDQKALALKKPITISLMKVVLEELEAG